MSTDTSKVIVLTAIALIATLETIAIFKGVDGTYFGLVIAAISGLAGYNLKEIVNNIKNK
jgi:hypothetical protein